MVWTAFVDLHSGGKRKEDFRACYIQAPEEEAINIFYNKFGRDPRGLTCFCCGNDYNIDESDTLVEATASLRGCAKSNSYISLEKYKQQTDVVVITDQNIKDEDRREQ